MGRRFTGFRHAASLAAMVALLGLVLVLVPLAVRHQQTSSGAQSYPSLPAVPAEPETVFVGGSTASGAGASKASERWSTLVSRTLGWQESNQAHAGAGFTAADGQPDCAPKQDCSFRGTMSGVVDAKPRVVVISTDLNAFDPSNAKDAAAVTTYFRSLRQSLPDATIIAVGPWTPQEKPSSQAVAMDKTVGSAVRAVRGVYVSLLNPALIDNDMTTAGGSKLNDIGHQAVADRLIGSLDESQN